MHEFGTCLKIVKKCGCAVATFNEFFGLMLFWIGSRHRAAALLLQVPENCTNLDVTLLYISISEAYSKIALKNKFLALAVCSPQPCSIHISPPNRSRLDYYPPIRSWRFPLLPVNKFQTLLYFLCFSAILTIKIKFGINHTRTTFNFVFIMPRHHLTNNWFMVPNMD